MSVNISSTNLNEASIWNGRRTRVIRPPSTSAFFSFRRNFEELIQYRDLLYTLTLHRIKVRYKQSRLGIWWAIIQPLAMTFIFAAVFSFIARVPTDGAPYPVFAYVAFLPWNCFASSVTNATGGLVNHSQLVTKVYFPREILPATYVLAALFDFAIGISVLAVMLIVYRVPLTMNVLYAVPIVLVLLLFSLGIAFLSSATQVRFRDIGLAVPLVLQLWMFATPIVYPMSLVPERLRSLYILNPMAGIIDNFRRVILGGIGPEPASLGIAAVVALALLIAAYAYFKHVEATMADII